MKLFWRRLGNSSHTKNIETVNINTPKLTRTNPMNTCMDSTWREQFLAIFGSASAFSSIDHNAKNWMKRRKRNQNMPSPSTINNWWVLRLLWPTEIKWWSSDDWRHYASRQWTTFWLPNYLLHLLQSDLALVSLHIRSMWETICDARASRKWQGKICA